MTGGDYSKVDVDLLADYVGGALHGTADEARVARLISDDAAWRAAYHDLSAAVDLVGADLRALGAAAEPMPDDVAERLDAAFAAAVASPAAVSPAPAPVSASPPPARHLSVVASGDGDGADDADGGGSGRQPSAGGDVSALPVGRGASSAAARRRRWRRWAGPTAVAAGVLAFVGFGVNQLNGQSSDAQHSSAAGYGAESSSDDNAARGPVEEPTAAAGGAPGSARKGSRVVASGTDYDRAGLVGQARSLADLEGSLRPQAAPRPQGLESAATPPRTPDGLDRLGGTAALTTCLDAVTRVHGEGPLDVDLVDYATFEGAPALVVFFADRDGDRWAWVTGPACGLSGVGADTRFSAQVR